MPRLLPKLRTFFKRKRKSKKERPLKHASNAFQNDNIMIQTSQSRSGRRLLGSRVLDCTSSNHPKQQQTQLYNRDGNKENKRNQDSEHHFSNFTTTDSFEGSESNSANRRKKLTMSWDELQRRNDSNNKNCSSTPTSVKPNTYKSSSEIPSQKSSANTITSIYDNELSPTAYSTCSAPLWGRRRGSDMEYSSIANDVLKHVPSARTISDQCFPIISSASSTSTLSVGLALSSVGSIGRNDNDGRGEKESTGTDMEEFKVPETSNRKFRGGRARMLYERERAIRKKYSEKDVVEVSPTSDIDCRKLSEYDCGSGEDLSPETLKIMEEVENAYQTSPIPASYIASPTKKDTMPVITLGRHKNGVNNEISNSRGHKKSSTTKKTMDASELLAKVGRGKKGTQNNFKEIKSRVEPPSGSTVASAFTSRIEQPNMGNIISSTNMEDTTLGDNMPRKVLTADASITQHKSVRRFDRDALSAPSKPVDKIAKSLEWEFSETTPPSSRSNSTSSIRLSNNTVPITSPPGCIGSQSKKASALAVQRERQQRKQRLSDANCSSNKADGRRNLDKRTARLRYAESFESDIMQHRQSFPHLNNGSNHSDKVGSHIQNRGVNGVSIAVRKRPIFDYELDRGDYDIVSIDNSTGNSHDKCIVHNCVMHPDMRQMLMKHVSYTATAAFDEHCSDDDVYKHVAEPLVMDAADGGVATILMYGQTGCGKSHTMSGIESRATHGLFEAIESLFTGKLETSRPTVSMQFVELCGSKECKDLLDPKLGDVKLADDEDGSVRLLNAASFEIKSPDDLLAHISLAKGRRATEATDKNGVSSRSHAVCQIQIKGKRRGVLTLIDCAGSERRHDSMYHTSERQKESAEINASLWALKECIRARASSSSRIPYRSSSLTRILRESFERENAHLCVIACVAPNATDTEHTMETLKTVATICGFEDKINEEKARAVTAPPLQNKKVLLPPKMWDHERLNQFLVMKKLDSKVKLSLKHDGKALMKMSLPQMRAQLFTERDKELAEKLFNALRRENDRVDKIQRTERVNLANARKGRP